MKQVNLFFLILLFYNCFGQTSDPILRLNTKMHLAKISSIDSDDEGQYILTVSNDKTAKIWDANTSSLLRTLRPPIDHGNEGMLFAGALSPDGRIAAVAGWTGKSGSEKNIYLFNPLNGVLLSRLSGVENVVQDLAFSPDGKFLAASLGSGYGVSIYYRENNNSTDFSLLKKLFGYEGDSYNISFSPDGLFASTCFDGYIRLYDNHFNLICREKGTGKKPFAIAFSPDGSNLAVSYLDINDVEVRTTRDLQLLYKPDPGKTDESAGFHNAISFSADGEYLFAGGLHKQKEGSNSKFVIRKWKDAGKGKYSDYPLCGNSITDIKELFSSKKRKNGIIFSGSQPEFGRMNLKGKNLYFKESELFHFPSNDPSHLKTNQTGNVIGFQAQEHDAIMFSVGDRNLMEEKADPEIESFTDENGNTIISNWQNSDHPFINDIKTDFLSPYEKCRSVDVGPYGDKIVFGANWSINCLDKNGTLLWNVPLQSTARAVNITPNGKAVVVAQDGIINWHSMKNGTLLLTLYIHTESKKWILFTPQGYYDASPGAENFIGWHLNNGPDHEAYFFPASKFRKKYYRPDVIDNVLISFDEAEALGTANKNSNRKQVTTAVGNMLPPVMNILSPHHNQEVNNEKVTLKYSVTSPGGESVISIKAMINGRPVDSQRGFKAIDENQGEINIIMPKEDATIQLLAENVHGWSSPAEVSLKWKGEPEELLKPTLYVLAVGVSNYENNDMNLKYAAKDAGDFVQTMKKQEGGLYKSVKTKILTDTDATKGNILDGLDWIVRETTSRDMAMIFLAGHGVNDNLGTFYFLPHEANLESMRRTCMMFTELKYTTSSIAGKVVAFVDACHSGGAMGGRRAVDINSLVNELSDVESGAVVFTSSTGKQYSLENESWGNGAFTEALIEGINGKADLFNKGKITIKSLDAWIAERVKALTNGQQTPTAVIPQSMSDFPIGIVK